MELDGPLNNTFQRSLFPEALHEPFALMDLNFQQMFFDRVGSAGTPNHDAQGSHPREATVEVKDSNIQTGPSSQASVVGNVTGHGSSYDPEFRETIIIDDDEDELSYGLSSQHANIPSSVSQPNPPLPTASNIQTGPSSQASVVGNVTGHGSSYDPEFRETIIIDDDEDELSYGLSSQHANIPSSVSQPNPPLPTASNIQTGPSNQASVVGNVTGHGSSYGPEFRETIIIDDDEDELSYGLSSQHTNIPSSVSQPNPPLPTASNIQTCPSSQASVVGNVIGHGSSYGPEFRETIIIDDDEDELSYGLSSQHTNIPSSVSQPNPPLPTASNIQTCPSSQASVVGNVIGHGSSYGPEFRETIIIDDDEDELSYGLSSQHTNIPSSVSQPNPPLPTASNIQTCPSSQASVVGNVIGHGSSYGLEFCETIIIDDEEDELSYGLSSQHANIPSSVSQPNPPLPTAPPLVHVTDNDIEEEMIRAAIEASKREAEGLVNTAELERTQYLDGINLGNHSSDEYMETAGGTVGRQELITGRAGTSIQPTDEEETLDVEEEPLVRQCSRRIPSGDTELTQPILPGDSPPSSSQPQNNDHQYNGTDFPSEWGGISFEEHDEAVMLEAAMFGGIPGARTYPLSIPSHGSSSYYPQAVHSPPLELTEQRLLRKQQDDEYLASLQADQEKEMKRLQEAELRQLEETAAKEAALEKQKQDEEERRKKQLENEEIESSLATKQASLPLEPPSDKEGVITLVVRMPDGSRQGRRFLKSDKFQSLFDFLDVGRTCRPGTYRLVRTYPRRAFTSADGDLSFSELGLTSKQEALFIEQINE